MEEEKRTGILRTLIRVQGNTEIAEEFGKRINNEIDQLRMKLGDRYQENTMKVNFTSDSHGRQTANITWAEWMILAPEVKPEDLVLSYEEVDFLHSVFLEEMSIKEPNCIVYNSRDYAEWLRKAIMCGEAHMYLAIRRKRLKP